MGNGGVDPVAESGMPPGFGRRRVEGGGLLGIQHAGIDVDPAVGRDAARIDFVRVEGTRLDPVKMVAGADSIIRDAQFSHPPPGVGFGHVMPFAGDSPGVHRMIDGDGG
jgi:hypothetical protein